MPRRFRTPFVALATLLSAAVPAAASPPAEPFPTLLGCGTATVDGIDSPGEWQPARAATFELQKPWGGTTWGEVRAMDDGTNLYLRFTTGETESDSYYVTIRFDADDDGACDVGDDLLTLDWGHLDDWFQHCDADRRDEIWSGTLDGFGDGWGSSGVFFFEATHPLDSADDGHDFSLARGRPVGFRLDLALCYFGNCTPTQFAPSATYSSGILLLGGVFADGFETGDLAGWTESLP